MVISDKQEAWALIIIGVMGTPFSILMSNSKSPYFFAGFVTVVIAGVLELRERVRAYLIMRFVLAVWAIIIAALYYPEEGISIVTVVYSLLGVTILVLTIRAYRNLM